ncbi:DoxX family protein [Saccharopolyspora pogona]|uniref:DoxX family protein n=1 Tax=Saccharopolyspora pogona TaxID=333966 RepID=UPI0016851A0A|nr:DoxX family protein [Saccharopolyspora pogona]
MTLLVLLIALLGLRGLDALGVRRFATWPADAAHALAIMLVMTASAHFAPADVTVMPTHDDLVRMVPPAVPFPSAMVYLTGVLEFLGALGLIIPWTRRATGYCLTLLFVVMLPANIYATSAEVMLAGEPVSPLWQRNPEQILYIAVAFWATRGASSLALRGAFHGIPTTESRR